HRRRPALGRRAQAGLAAGRDRPRRARALGLRAFPGAADGLRRSAWFDRRRDRAGDGPAEMAPDAANAQGGGTGLGAVADGVRGRVLDRARRRLAGRGAALRSHRLRPGLGEGGRIAGAAGDIAEVVYVGIGGHVGGIAGDRVDRGHVVRDDILGGQVLVDILAIVGLIVVPAGGEG